jgi:hypothetical protein
MEETTNITQKLPSEAAELAKHDPEAKVLASKLPTEQEMQQEMQRGTLYHPAFWGAYKGHVRGLMRGLTVGALAGLGVGLGLVALAGVLHLAAIPALALVATFAGVGSVIGAELMGKIGNTAGNVASYFAQMEIRARYPSLPEITPGSPAPGIGHNFEVPPDANLKKPFLWRVAIPGMVLGVGLAGLLSFGGGAELLSEVGFEVFKHLGEASHIGMATTAATLGAGGLLGASFGINRGMFRKLFNYTDSAYDEGRLTGPKKEQIARDQARYKVQDPNNPYPVTGAQMHEEYQRLLNGYFKKAFTASWSGDRRGLLGGALAGGLSGLVAGGLVVGVAVLAGLSIGSPFIPAIIMLTTALGTKQGIHIFADAGRESAAISVAHEIHAERLSVLAKGGHDISFDEAEKRACTRMAHHPDMNPPGTENKTWFNWKIALIGLAVGAAVGLALTPLAAPFITHIISSIAATAAHAAPHAGHAAAHLVWDMAAVKAAIPITVSTFSLAGAMMGMGDKLMEKMYGFADKVFMGTFFPGHHVEDHINHDYPPLGPDSKLRPQVQQAIAASAEKPHAVQTPEQEASVAHTPPPSAVVKKILEGGAQHSMPLTEKKPQAGSFVERRKQETATQGLESNLALARP